MHILSTRKVANNDWTYFKVDDDLPLYYSIGAGGSFAYADVTPIPDAATTVGQLVDEAKANMPTSPMIVVFVHGYNNTVASAGKTAQTIYAGLQANQLNPAMAVLCWSTDGKLQNYEQDRSDARASALVVGRILRDLNAHPDVMSGVVALNVIGHSMGNYLLDIACESVGLSGQQPARLFHHSISVAADINRDDFNVGQEGDSRCRQSSRMTFYYDGWDGTLATAELVLHRERFGQLGPHHWDLLNPNTIGVNCSDVIRAHTDNPAAGAIDVEIDIHSGYFVEQTFYQDLQQVFMGVSAGNITTRNHPRDAPPNSYRLQKPS